MQVQDEYNRNIAQYTHYNESLCKEQKNDGTYDWYVHYNTWNPLRRQNYADVKSHCYNVENIAKKYGLGLGGNIYQKLGAPSYEDWEKYATVVNNNAKNNPFKISDVLVDELAFPLDDRSVAKNLVYSLLNANDENNTKQIINTIMNNIQNEEYFNVYGEYVIEIKGNLNPNLFVELVDEFNKKKEQLKRKASVDEKVDELELELELEELQDLNEQKDLTDQERQIEEFKELLTERLQHFKNLIIHFQQNKETLSKERKLQIAVQLRLNGQHICKMRDNLMRVINNNTKFMNMYHEITKSISPGNMIWISKRCNKPIKLKQEQIGGSFDDYIDNKIKYLYLNVLFMH